MDIAHPIHTEISSLSFSFLSTDDIKAMSVQKCDNPVLLDNLNLPTRGGSYDPKLGPMTSRDVCETCHSSYFACPGHYGHIESPAPVYHPSFMNQAYKSLYATCLYCHHFKMPKLLLHQYIARIKLLNAGLIAESHEVAKFMPTGREEEAEAADDDDEEQGSKKKAKKGPKVGAVDAQTAEESIIRSEKYVEAQLHRASKRGGTKDAYKDGSVYQERRASLDDVLRVQSRSWRVKCTRCLAHNPTYRKEKATKIIELEIDAKQKLVNATLGVKRMNVLSDGPSKAKKKKANGANGSANVDDSDVERGSQAGEDNEMDVDESVHSSEEEEEEDEDDNGNEISHAVARTASGQVKGARARNERVMSVAEVRAHLRILFYKEKESCFLLYGRHGGPHALASRVTPIRLADLFFSDVIPVTPTRFRPPAKMGDELFENAQNSLSSAVITTSKRIVELSTRLHNADRAEKGEMVLDAIQKTENTRNFEMLLEALVKLQDDVNSFMDSSKNPTIMRQGKSPPPGVKQSLEKKEGSFRKHMMGKRVNYAARSVISPDINIETNEIGIPPVFAKKLTYPEPVTHHNIAEMRQLVINGPKVHPGAALVQNEDGSQISSDKTTSEQRTAIANQLLTPQSDALAHTSGPPPRNKKVYRHIRDGDIVILNRQPTSHKPSMMAHKVKVLLGEKTIRMHYANCNSYNADFDGDEMNIHFPQNEVARAEALMIANTDNQYLVPTSGKPLRGLIQDHVDAGVWMCNKSSFFTRDQYFQLIYGALRTENNYSGQGRIITSPPAVWKPKQLWTGKQIMSTILSNLTPPSARGLNLTSRNKIQHNLWDRDQLVDKNMSEEMTIFLDGHLITGVLDKSQFGASDYGLIHSVHELYGPMIANRLLGVLSRVLTKYLQHYAFSCRMDDLILTQEGEDSRKKILQDASEDGTRTALGFVGLDQDADSKDPDTARNLTVRLEEILRNDNSMAGLDGAMQGAFNKTTSKINNEVLPKYLVRPFPDNNMQMMTISGAKGSKVNASQISTLLGQQALEGRRVPTMVSGKTSPSFRPFDTSARAGGFVANRFLTGIRPQEYYFHCMAGREGLIDTAVKTSRSGYLQRCLIKHLEGVKVHYDHTVRDSDQSILQFSYGEDSLDVTRSKHLEMFDFAARNHDSLIQRYNPKPLLEKVVHDEAVSYMKKALKKPGKYDPALSVYSPSRYFGSMSEKYAAKVTKHVEENEQGLLSTKGVVKPSPFVSERVDSKQFVSSARARYMRSLADPGEAVGSLASQGVGEPSTQMTLNTFHLAGHGAANVTLGIPRSREIVMTAAQKPQTPTMKSPLRETVSDEDCEAFIKQVSKLTLSEVVERVVVTERLSSRTSTDARLRKYTVSLEFYPPEEYSKEYALSPDQLHEALAFNLSWRLKKELVAEMRTAKQTSSQDMSVGVGLKVRSGADGDDVEESEESQGRRGRDDELDDDDNDAGQAKRARQNTQHEYEEDDAMGPGLKDMEDYVERESEEDEQDEEEAMDIDPAHKAAQDRSADQLADTFKQAAKYATSFSFDSHTGRSAQFDLEFPADAPKLSLVDIVERTCRASVIHEVPGIGRCMKVYDDKGKFSRTLVTEGANLRGMHSLADELVDSDRSASNDIYALLTTYGVEAARKAIIDEMSSVFGAYAIAVDYRHLTIIADYMTHGGGYRPFNRTGISNKSSPLLKASFETTVQFLSEAVSHGDFDDLSSPAAKIVMGKPSTSGTGSFDVRAQAVYQTSDATKRESSPAMIAAAA